MPIGCSSLVPFVVAALEKLRPQSVLDLGIGFGLYGAAVRQWLDAGVQPWRTYLVGVEGWPGYRSPCWDLYSAIHCCEIRDWLDTTTEAFNAILLMDVIEHFEKPVGVELLECLKRRLSPGGILMVGTPAIWQEQGAVYGNELERHRALWTADEFGSAGFAILVDGRPNEFGHQMLLAGFHL